MAHDLQYFVNEIGKVRATAINRGWTAPPNIDVQIIFRSGGDPRDADVEMWAATLHHIEMRHQLPLTISGGGFGCFAVAATCQLGDGTRFVGAVEKDIALQGLLNRARAKVIEIWRYTKNRSGTNSNLELLVPKSGYSCVLATSRKSVRAIRAGDRVAFDNFTNELGDLTLGNVDVWVYDPRAIDSPGVIKRMWRKLTAPLHALQSEHVEHSDLSVIDPSELSETHVRANAPHANFNVFVHGYATTIKGAISSYGRFIHKVRYDQLPTSPILYCWPSAGDPTLFFRDTDNAQISYAKFTQLIDLLSSKRAPAPSVDILAHSHGTKLVMGGLITPSLKSAPRAHPASIRNLVFIAPDIATEFFDEYFANLKQKVGFITIYFSRGDFALTISSWLQTARLGKLPKFPSTAVDTLDFIDASSLNAEILGHSYHVNCAEMQEDIRGLLDGKAAQSRKQLKQQKSDARMWTLVPYQQ